MDALANHYIATWNATDPVARARLLAEHWCEDVTYTDPLTEVAGHQGIGATIGAVQDQFPGFVFSLVGSPDTHHQQTRFQWGLGPAGADPIIIGFDVLVAAEDGRIRQVLGFLDQIPA